MSLAGGCDPRPAHPIRVDPVPHQVAFGAPRRQTQQDPMNLPSYFSQDSASDGNSFYQFHSTPISEVPPDLTVTPAIPAVSRHCVCVTFERPSHQSCRTPAVLFKHGPSLSQNLLAVGLRLRQVQSVPTLPRGSVDPGRRPARGAHRAREAGEVIQVEGVSSKYS